MGSIGKAIGNITKPATQVVSKITPWNDETEGIIPINHITPWNDDTTTGKLTNAALLAAAAYGATQYFSGANAANTTTASQMATAPSADAAATAGAATQQPVMLASLTPQELAGTQVVSDVPNTLFTGSSTMANTAPSSLATTTTTMPELIPALEQPVSISGGLSAAYTPPTTSGLSLGANSASSGGLFSSIGSFMKSHPLASTMIGSGLAQGVGGYLSAQEMAKAQKAAAEEQRRQFDALHNYGGSFGGKGGVLKTPQAGIKQVNSVVDAKEILQKIQYDPTYKKGFETMASKLINPDEANAILSAYKKYMGV